MNRNFSLALPLLLILHGQAMASSTRWTDSLRASFISLLCLKPDQTYAAADSAGKSSIVQKWLPFYKSIKRGISPVSMLEHDLASDLALAAAARKNGIDRSPDYLAWMSLYEVQALKELYITKMSQEFVPTEQEIRKYYDDHRPLYAENRHIVSFDEFKFSNSRETMNAYAALSRTCAMNGLPTLKAFICSQDIRKSFGSYATTLKTTGAPLTDSQLQHNKAMAELLQNGLCMPDRGGNNLRLLVLKDMHIMPARAFDEVKAEISAMLIAQRMNESLSGAARVQRR